MRLALSLFGMSLIVVCAGTSSASGAPAADVGLKAAFEARYAAMKAAMAAHDATALKSMLAPGFTSVDVSGQSVDAAQMVAEVGGLPPDPHRESRTTLLSVSPSPSAVTVEQRYVMTTIKAGAKGMPHMVELVTLSTDTWIRPESVWLIERTVTHEASYLVDGQLIAHRVAP